MAKNYFLSTTVFLSIFFISLKTFSQNPSVGGQWSDLIPFEIVPVAAANLPDGRLITWSSKGRNSFFGEDGFTYTQIFDPFAGPIGRALLRKASDTDHDMFCPGVNNLPDGRILSAGGLSSERTSIYDYVTDTWQRADDMNIPRGYQGNVTTTDGGVFTIGGSWSGDLGGKDAEIWYPETGWLQIPGVTADLLVEGNDPILDEPNPGQTQYRSDNHVWLWPAPNGKIFHAGPGTDMHWIDINNLNNATVQNVGSRLNDTYSMKGTTVMYDVGKLLKVGGARTYSSGTPANDRTYTIDINQNTPIVTAVSGFKRARTMHNSTVLPNGNVLVTGGLSTATVFSDTGASLVGEIFDPVTNSWSDTEPMKVARTYHSVAILMADARVFLGGGGLCGNDPGCINHLDAEIYSPPYLFKSNGSLAVRPAISAPAESDYNAAINVTGTSGIAEFALLRSSSATHSTNNEQRRIPLSFAANGSSYTVNIPQREILPPGYYMLFGLNQAGVPSLAAHIKIGSTVKPGTSPNLVLDLKFDEGTGINAFDSSNLGNHATIIERDNNQNPIPVTKSYWTANGLFGSALEMDGFEAQSNSIVEVPFSSSLDGIKDGMTVMAWINRDEIVNNVSILAHHYPKFFFGFHNSLYKLEFATTEGSANCYAGYSPAKKWVHIAGTYDGEQAKLYANGIEICSVETTGDITTQSTGQFISSFTTSGFYSGSQVPGNSGITDELDGKIDELKVFNKAFGNSEIEAYYNLGVQTQNQSVVDCAPDAIIAQYRIGTSGSWITSNRIPAGLGSDVYIRANVAAQEDYFVTLPAGGADTYSSASDFSNNGYRIGNSFGIDFSNQGQYVLTSASGCAAVITLLPEATCADIFPEYRVNGVWSSGFEVLTLNEGDNLSLSIIPDNTVFTIVTPDGTDKTLDEYEIGLVNTGHAGIYTFSTPSGCIKTLQLIVNNGSGCTLTPEHTVNGIVGIGNLTANEGDQVRLGVMETGTVYTINAPDGSLLNGSPTSGFDLGQISTTQAGVYTFNTRGVEGLPIQGVTAIFADSQETSGEDGQMANALDGNPNTFWHTRWEVSNDPQPHEIHLDLGSVTAVGAMTYLPRQDGDTNGTIARYEVYVSNNTTNWGTPVSSGTWFNDTSLKTITFPSKQGRYVRLRSLSEVNGGPWASAAEITVFQSSSGSGCIAQLMINVTPIGACTITPEHTVNGLTGIGNITVEEGGQVVLSAVEIGADYTVNAPDGSAVTGNPLTGFNLGSVTPEQSGTYTFISGSEGLGSAYSGVSAIFADSEETVGEDGKRANAVDGNPNTFWHTEWLTANTPQPHEIHLDLGSTKPVGGISYLPRQDGAFNGTIAGYEIYVSNSTTNWGTALAAGTWAKNKSTKTATFASKQGRYVRLLSTSEVNGNQWTCTAEIKVLAGGSGVDCTAELTIDVIPASSCTLTPEHIVNGATGTGNVTVNLGDTIILGVVEPNSDYTVTDPNGNELVGNPTTGFPLGAITRQQSGIYTFAASNLGTGRIIQGVSAIFADSQETSGEDGEMANAVDGNPNTFWHTRWEVTNDLQPHEIHLDLGATTAVEGFTYLPRQDASTNGNVAGYEIYVSNSTTNWGTAVATGTWPNGSTLKTVNFPAKQGRYVRFRSISEVGGNPWTSAAELQVIGSALIADCTEQLTITVNGNASLKNSVGTDATKKDIQVYPNPTRNAFSVDMTDLMNVPLTVHVFNGQGQEVLRYKMDEGHKEVEHIDISNLSVGVYRVILSEPNGKPYRKSVILQR